MVISERGLRSLLSDRNVLRSLAKKLKPRILRPRKPKKGDRIRDYRDHGTARPAGQWTDKYWMYDRRFTRFRRTYAEYQKNWPEQVKLLLQLPPKKYRDIMMN
jgi:hypothetical protein